MFDGPALVFGWQPRSVAARVETSRSGKLFGQEALQLDYGDEPAPPELDGAEPALTEKPVDRVVADV